MKGGMGNLLKHAKKMQEDLEKAQQELVHLEVTGEAGGGMVKITMNGKHEVRRVNIDSTLVGDDKEMLEDLIAAAVNDAVRRVQETTQERFAGLATGLQGMKLPF